MPISVSPLRGGLGTAGASQYDRLNAAMQLDQDAALKSASWGLGQIMGENFEAAGFATAEVTASAMTASEDNQLKAIVSFMTAMGLVDLLKSHNWAAWR